MPLALDPEARFELVLESDADKPAGERPTFVCRFMPNRDWKVVAHVADRIGELAAEGIEAMLTQMEDALALALVDWRHMGGIDYARERIPDVLTPGELVELIQKAVQQTSVSVAEKNASGSQSPSDGDGSASTATPPEPAPEDPASESPSSSSAPVEEEASA